MTDVTREARLVDVFTTLADTLVDDYDIVELLQTLVDSCVDLFDADAAGILLVDEAGILEVIASTSEASRIVELMQVNGEAGPCFESFMTGQVIAVPDVHDVKPEWQLFAADALAGGFTAVHAIPLRLRDVTIGALNLLRSEAGSLEADDVRAAQALADVATIGVLHERSLRESLVVREQLQRALQTRVVIEQAKGVLSQVHGISTDEAFARLRSYARSHGQLLSVLAEDVVRRRVTL